MWGLTLLAAAIVGGLATVAVLRARLAIQRRQLREAVGRGEFRWAARVRFGADHLFKGASGSLLGENDGTIRFEPSAHDKRRGIEASSMGSDSVRWLPGRSRDLLSGVKYRTIEIRVEGQTHIAAVFAVVGDPD